MQVKNNNNNFPGVVGLCATGGGGGCVLVLISDKKNSGSSSHCIFSPFYYPNRTLIDLVAHATIVTKIETDAKTILTAGSVVGRREKGSVEHDINVLSTNFPVIGCAYIYICIFRRGPKTSYNIL
jgi:hypothetical protein